MHFSAPSHPLIHAFLLRREEFQGVERLIVETPEQGEKLLKILMELSIMNNDEWRMTNEGSSIKNYRLITTPTDILEVSYDKNLVGIWFVWYFFWKKYPKAFRGTQTRYRPGSSMNLFSSRSDSDSPKNLFLFLDAPRRIFIRVVFYFAEKVRPANPLDCFDFVGIYDWLVFCVADVNGAYLVFHHTVFCELITIGWCFFHPWNTHTEFVSESPFYCVDIWLIESRMTTTTIRPSEWPGFFDMTSLLEEEFFFFVKEENRKCTMKRCDGSVYFWFWHGSENGIVLIDEDDEFWRIGHGSGVRMVGIIAVYE
jgi:hypothetical protein